MVIDEIQKIDNWAEIVKPLWDADTFAQLSLKVILLGSSRLLLQQGFTESLAGRFEVTPLTHWTLREIETAFGFTPDQYVWFGGYLGAASLIDDEPRWCDYVLNSLIETTVSKDILMLTRVDKPALLRWLFELGRNCLGQILSYTRPTSGRRQHRNPNALRPTPQLGRSADGPGKYAVDVGRQRASIPEWQVQNSALSSVFLISIYTQARANPVEWGRWVETAIGEHLCRSVWLGETEPFYWRESNDEVDFVVRKGRQVIGLEVKSGRTQRVPAWPLFNAAPTPTNCFW